MCIGGGAVLFLGGLRRLLDDEGSFLGWLLVLGGAFLALLPLFWSWRARREWRAYQQQETAKQAEREAAPPEEV